MIAIALAVDYIIGRSGFRVYPSFRMSDRFALLLFEVFFRVGFAVDDIELIINGIVIEFLAILKSQTYGSVLLRKSNGGLVIDDIIIGVVLVIILLNIPIATRCCI
jgi:hypothetical protein